MVLCDCISNKCRSEEEVTVKDGSYYDKKSAKCLPYAGLSQFAVLYWQTTFFSLCLVQISFSFLVLLC